MNLQEQVSRIKTMMGLVIESDDFDYIDPNFDMEWEEAERYIDHPNPDKIIGWTKEEWLEKVMNGKVMNFSEIPDLENITDPSEFEELLPEKIQRFMDAFSKKIIELPIAVKFPNGVYDLIAGNTRVTGLRNKGYDPKIWVFEL
jgi:hypothetical protein